MPSSRPGPRLLTCLAAACALVSCILGSTEEKDPGSGPRIRPDSTFYESGKLETVWMMKDSLRHGYFLTYYETGERMKQGHYVEGKQRGWFFFWWQNGQLKQEWYIKPGETYAICVKIRDENGVLTRNDSCDAQNYLDTTYKQLTRL